MSKKLLKNKVIQKSGIENEHTMGLLSQNLGALLRIKRKELGMDQAQLSRAINVSTSNVSRLETGSVRFKEGLVRRLVEEQFITTGDLTIDQFLSVVVGVGNLSTETLVTACKEFYTEQLELQAELEKYSAAIKKINRELFDLATKLRW